MLRRGVRMIRLKTGGVRTIRLKTGGVRMIRRGVRTIRLTPKVMRLEETRMVMDLMR